MINMIEKIQKIYPELTLDDFFNNPSIIWIQNDSDGKGDYIAKWEHPTLARPTVEQLK
jgi:hypothetical protein